MDLNVIDCDGNNGLIAACMEGRLEIVKILVEASTNLNTKNEFGLSALEMAHEEDHDNIVEFLRAQFSAAGVPNPKLRSLKRRKFDTCDLQRATFVNVHFGYMYAIRPLNRSVYFER